MEGKTSEEYPFVLNAHDISNILKISKPTAYKLMNHPTFPIIKVCGPKRVLRDDFFNWISSSRSM